MYCSGKFRALMGAFLVVVLAFAPLINVAPTAFAEGDVEAEFQDFEVQEANDTKSESQADEPVTYGGETLDDWDKTDNDDGSITLTKYKGQSTDVIIPGELEGMQVRFSGFDIFEGIGVTSLTIGSEDHKVIYDNTFGFNAFSPVGSTLVKLNMEGFDVSKLTNAQQLFTPLKLVTTLDLSHLKFTIASNIIGLFNGCSNLKSVNLAGSEFPVAKGLDNLFLNCSSLETVELGDLISSNITNLGSTFSGCRSLRSINYTTINTSNVTYMGSLYNSCSSLTDLDVGRFNTSKVTSMSSMFYRCSSLVNLDLSNFDTSNVSTMASMFGFCSSLTNLNISSFNTSSVTTMEQMFISCRALTNLDLSNFDTSSVLNMVSMFNGCNALENLNLSNFDTSKVSSMNTMFQHCWSLKQLDLSSFDTSNVRTMYIMFYNCYSLVSVKVNNFNTANVNNMASMFDGCTSLADLDVSGFNTSNVTIMNRMFNQCKSLQNLDVSGFDTSKVVDISGMFSSCNALKTVDVSNFDTPSVDSFNDMFRNTNVNYFDLSSFNFKDNSTFDNMFDVLTDSDGTVTEIPTAIIATDPKLKALEQDGKLGNGRIPYQSTITFNEDEIATQANDDSANVKTIKAGKIFYDSAAEFQEAQKAFTLTKDQVLAEIAEPTKADFTFNGWFTDASATTPLGDTLILAGTGDNVTLYAGWTAIEPAPGPETGDVDNPGSDVSGDEIDSTEHAADEASVSTATPVTGDNVAIVAGIALSMLILTLSTVVFARKRRQQ